MSEEAAAPSAATIPWMEKHRPSSIAHVAGAGMQSVLRAMFHDPCPTWTHDRADGSSCVYRVDELPADGAVMVRRGGSLFPAPLAAYHSLQRTMFLFTGPPGCGKTSTASAIIQCMNLEMIELNCSMTRGAAAADFIMKLVQSKSSATRPRALLLEEIDNMDGAAQRRLADLLTYFEDPRHTSSSTVVIATCNSAEAIEEPLASVLFSVSFPRLEMTDVEHILRQVLRSEGQVAHDRVIQSIADHSDADARRAINDLQFFCELRSCFAFDSDDACYEKVRFACGIFDREMRDLLRPDYSAGQCYQTIEDLVCTRGVHPQELFFSLARVVLAWKGTVTVDMAEAMKKWEHRIAIKPSVLQIVSCVLSMKRWVHMPPGQ
jgi:Cdc6-like AAA superfamily ATPase